MSAEDTRAELVELVMQQAGHDGPVLIAETTGEVVHLSAAWWSEVDAELTRLTVNLIGAARSALSDAAHTTGHSPTDVVNRALQLYRELVDAGPGDSITWPLGNGVDRTVTITRDVETIRPAGEVL